MAKTALEKKLDLAERVLEKNAHADVSEIMRYIGDDAEKNFAKEYIFSIIFAPFGVYYFLRYITGRYTRQAFICLALTCIMTLIYIKISSILIAPLLGQNLNIVGNFKDLGF